MCCWNSFGNWKALVAISNGWSYNTYYRRLWCTVSEPNTGDYRKRYFFYDGQDLIGFHGGNILESIEHFRSSLRIQVMWFVFFNWSILAVGPDSCSLTDNSIYCRKLNQSRDTPGLLRETEHCRWINISHHILYFLAKGQYFLYITE